MKEGKKNQGKGVQVGKETTAEVRGHRERRVDRDVDRRIEDMDRRRRKWGKETKMID